MKKNRKKDDIESLEDDNNLKVTERKSIDDEKNQKIKRITIVLFLVLITILILSYIFVFSKTKILKYTDKNYLFRYDSNFKVKKEKMSYNLVSKDGSATITVKILKRDEVYKSESDEAVSSTLASQIMNDLKGYLLTYNECGDHLCTMLYENKKNEEQIELNIEYRDDIVVIYMYHSSNKQFDIYEESFKIVVNSFVEVQNEKKEK